MIHIEREAWTTLLAHLRKDYPREGCGILLGRDGGTRVVTEAFPCRNAYDGERGDRFQLDPLEQLAAERRARQTGLDVLGFFHSHPDEDSYFSRTDLENSWPWYSNVVVSLRERQFHAARCFRANDDRTASTEEPLSYDQDPDSGAVAPVHGPAGAD
jgi:proteasome lid subunit RPN8/RPN11